MFPLQDKLCNSINQRSISIIKGRLGCVYMLDQKNSDAGTRVCFNTVVPFILRETLELPT